MGRAMLRYNLIFGTIAGIIVSALLVLGVVLGGTGGMWGMVFGYLSMLVAMSFVFVGVKRYRDVEKGGVIRFWPALGLGFLIALLASLFYVFTWEAYTALSGGTWMADYMAATIETRREAGASPEEIAALAAQMESFAEQYANWWFRMPVTLSEILPVGLIVALVSAGLLRNPRFLPAHGADRPAASP